MNLREYLKENGFSSQKHCKEVALQIAKGLAYVHRHGVVHSNVKSSNILLLDDGKEMFRAVITVEEAMHVGTTDTETAIKMHSTLWYTPPEMLKDQTYGLFTDVYSYGILLWEIFSPFLEMENYVSLLDQGKRPDLSKAMAPEYVKNLMEKCWSGDYHRRPSMGEVVSRLESQNSDLPFLAEIISDFLGPEHKKAVLTKEKLHELFRLVQQLFGDDEIEQSLVFQLFYKLHRRVDNRDLQVQDLVAWSEEAGSFKNALKDMMNG